MTKMVDLKTNEQLIMSAKSIIHIRKCFFFISSCFEKETYLKNDSEFTGFYHIETATMKK